MISLNSTQMMSTIKELTSNNQSHGLQETLVMTTTLIATTTAQVTSDGSWVIKSLREMKSTRIKLMTMNLGKSSMNCYLRDPMERPRPTHLLPHLILLVNLTQIAIGHLQKLATPSPPIRHSAHLRYQAQLLLVHLAPRPMKIAL